MGAAASAQKNFDQFVGSDGKLDLQEFGLMFKNAGQGGAVSQEQVVKLFEAFDRSGDGEVTARSSPTSCRRCMRWRPRSRRRSPR